VACHFDESSELIEKKAPPLSLPPHIAREYLPLEFRITDYDSNPGIGG